MEEWKNGQPSHDDGSEEVGLPSALIKGCSRTEDLALSLERTPQRRHLAQT
jgi:hypothetical protein